MFDYEVLPANGARTTHMNGEGHEWLVNNRFADWRQACFGDDEPAFLIQDHERCLWQDRNLTALRVAGCKAVANFPKTSPDLNVIENWWHVLRVRLEFTAPDDLESRGEFLTRLRRTVNWLNEHRAEHALSICTDQKARAKDVLLLHGAKTKW